jgi:hypothetical protein
MAALGSLWPLLALGTSLTLPQEPVCPAAANQSVEAGWAAYRSGRLDTAREMFEGARNLCRDHVGALVGLGYSLLQLDQIEQAGALFTEAGQTEPSNIDALLGLGLVAWRSGEIAQSQRIFDEVLELEPGNETAREFLARTGRALGIPPARPALTRPDSTVLHSRTHEGHFDVLGPSGWEPFYVTGVNLGTALPGKFATEFPDSITYATWLEQIGAMGANTIRLYTVHPPRFYNALAAYNMTHAEPLRLVHGAWATLPPDNDYNNDVWRTDFYQEMHDVVDLIHGRADLPPQGDEGFRHYTADVARWVVAFVFGREWEPETIAAFNRAGGGPSDWTGDYVGVRKGTPAEVWMAQASEEMIRYEMEAYRSQRPIAYTNWPTLDPLRHRSEATNAEEVTILAGLGGLKYLDPEAPNQDSESLDASRMFSTTRFPAGHFVSYHAYPYHPDFMLLDRAIRNAPSPFGASNYFGYLTALKEHHADIPVLIAEYGVPASWGIAHFQPQGWHHGGHSESEQATINSRLTREIAAAGMAGGILFSWIDEWFKRTWLLRRMALPEERNRLWYNRLDPEQHYGVIAMEPELRLRGRTIEERNAEWGRIEPLYNRAEFTLRTTADEAYLWLHVIVTNPTMPGGLFVGFDLASPNLGDRRWPGQVGSLSPVGLEFVLSFDGETAEVLADSAVNPWMVEPIYEDLDSEPGWTELDGLPRTPPGAFTGRWQARANIPFRSNVNSDGEYTPLRVVVRRHRIARDSTEHPATGYNRGVLTEGPAPDGAWEQSEDGTAVEIRIPWMLINITDPSSKNVLSGADGPEGPYRSQPIESINIVATYRSADSWIPVPDRSETVSAFAWDRWERPRWTARARPLFRHMQTTFRDLQETALRTEHR